MVKEVICVGGGVTYGVCGAIAFLCFAGWND
jgi:hypothetical protein